MKTVANDLALNGTIYGEICGIDGFSGAWHDNKAYWEDVDTKTLVNGGIKRMIKARMLKQVCWFEITATFENVKAGTYLVAWRIFLYIPNPAFQKIYWFIGAKKHGSPDQQQIQASYLQQLHWKGLHALVLPIPFTVTILGSTVYCTLLDHSGSWKSGVAFGSAHLIPWQEVSCWTPDTHRLFSLAFKEAVKTFLLVNQRISQSLPSFVVHIILDFLAANWLDP